MDAKTEEALGQQAPVQDEKGAEDAFAAAFGQASSEAAGAEPAAGQEGDGEPQGPAPSAGDEGDGEASGPEGEAAPSGEATPPDEDAEIRRKAQMFDAQEGRLRKLQQEIATLRASAGHEGGAVENKLLAELPEDIREDAEAFAKNFPDHADLVREDSRDGKRLRKLLAEYGPDHVLVETEADRLMDKRQQLTAKTQELAEMEQSIHVAHFQAIAEAHPDFGALASADLTQPENKAKLDAYKARVRAWIETKPFKEGSELNRIADAGTPAQVIGMLNRFKEETGPKARQDKTRQAAEAGMVPKGKPTPRPPLDNDKPEGTYDDGWNKAGKK